MIGSKVTSVKAHRVRVRAAARMICSVYPSFLPFRLRLSPFSLLAHPGATNVNKSGWDGGGRRGGTAAGKWIIDWVIG